MIDVQKHKYGVIVIDTETSEQVVIDKEELRDLIGKLQQHLEWDFNEVALQAGCGCVVINGKTSKPCHAHRVDPPTSPEPSTTFVGFLAQARLYSASFDKEPNAFGGTVELGELPPHHHEED